MSSSSIRKRGKKAAGQVAEDVKVVDDQNGAPEESKETASTQSVGGYLTSALFIVVLSAVAYVLYNTPHLLTGPLSDFMGFEADVFATDSEEVQIVADEPKRDAVIAAFKHAWLAYERDAMGADEYHPLSHKGSNLTEAGGIGYTVIDSIDTMLLMGLDEEYSRARSWVTDKLTFERDGLFNTFETTIRVLGGLLSAYALTKDQMYLDKAIELGDRMMPVFDTPSGLPTSNVNLAKRLGQLTQDNDGLVSTAEAATLQLEFRYLSHLTDDEKYWRAVEKVMVNIKKAHLTTGLASIFMNPKDGRFVLSAIRLGSRGDSYYEYLLKQYLQTNHSEPVYQEMYDEAVGGVQQHLVQKSAYTKMTYTSELIPEHGYDGQVTWRLTPKQDHLVCFFPGNLMLGAVNTGAIGRSVSIPPRAGELTPNGKRDWKTGVELLETCMRTHDTATGLAPEIVHFRIPSDAADVPSLAASDWYIKGAAPGAFPPYDARYMLRPETVESLFIAYRLTGDVKYRDYGWGIFQAIETHCKVETGGYATVVSVDEIPARHEDKMETFLMSETLKYLFLLFSDDTVLPFSEWVFNTEAHPLPIIKPSIRTAPFS